MVAQTARFFIRACPVRGRVSTLLWGSALALLPLALLGLAHPALHLLLLVPVGLGAVAFHAVRRDRVCVDPQERLIRLPDRTDLRFDEITGVYLRSRRPEFDPRGAATAMLYRVELAMGESRTKALAEHTSELRMWSAAERLSKALQVPMTDFCGDRITVRSPEELDKPLVERLTSTGLIEPPDGQPPDELSVRSEVDSLTIACRRRRWLATSSFLSLAALAYLAAAGAAGEFFSLAIGFATLGTAGAVAGVMTWVGPNNIIVADAAHVTHYRRGLFRRTARVPLSELELIRVERAPRPCLTLLSDRQLVRCYMSEEAADWARRRLENFIVRD